MSTSQSVFEEIETRIRGETDFNKKLVLLFKTQNDANVDEFHKQCDAKGPTVTILYGAHNTIFGGYTSRDWSSPENKRTMADKDAFLFSKNDNEDAECVFLPIKKDKTDVAITCYANYGPTFGGGGKFASYDLLTFKKNPASEFKEGFLYLNGSMRIKNAYSNEAEDCQNRGHTKQQKIKTNDINSGKMVVKHLEVYQVLDDGTDEDWLKKPREEEINKKKDDLIGPLDSMCIDRYNILFIGPIAAGKSSLINTLSTVFSGQFEPVAPAGQSPESFTRTVTKYAIKSKTDERRLKMVIHDMPGFEHERGLKIELKHILDGTLPANYKFQDMADNKKLENITGKTNQAWNDRIHLVCLIVAGDKRLEEYSKQQIRHLQDLQNEIQNSGLQEVIVATKFDKVCPNISRNLEHLFQCLAAKEAVTRISSFFGVPDNHVFPVVNYLGETEEVKVKNMLAVNAFYWMLKTTESYLSHHIDLRKLDSWCERKTLLPKMENDDDKRKVLKNIHESNLALENKELRILVVGPTGSGKSSFIDSIASALRNEIVFPAVGIGSACAKVDNAAVSATNKFQLYVMQYSYDGSTRQSNIYLGDTPGIQEQDGITEDSFKSIINGNVPDKYHIADGIKESQKEFKNEVGPCEKIHCICFVFDCESIQKEYSKKMTTFIRNLLQSSSEDCPYVVVLTKCDKVSESLRTVRRRVFEDVKVTECKEKLREMFSVRQQRVFPVVNYKDDNFVDLQADALLLAVFLEMINLGKQGLKRFEEKAVTQF